MTFFYDRNEVEKEIKEFQSFASSKDNKLFFENLLHLDASSEKLFSFLVSINKHFKIDVNKVRSLKHFSISLDPSIQETIARQRDTWVLHFGR